jgi:hypothetical protein
VTYTRNLGHAVKALRYKVAGSIPDGVTRIFHLLNPSSRTMALESIEPLTEMSTRNVFWGGGGGVKKGGG